MRTLHRGSALLAALVVIGVLALVTAATMRLATLSKTHSVRDSRKISQAACVEAARQHLIARLNVFGLASPQSVTFVDDVTTDTGTRKLRTGHIVPNKGDTPVITAAKTIPYKKFAGGARTAVDRSNKILPAGFGSGNYFNTVVTCSDPVAGEMELEFTIKYGL